MESFNLFANIESLDDMNYSFGESINEDMHDVVELPNEISPKPAVKSSKTRKGKAKAKKQEDLCTSDNEGSRAEDTEVIPGVGQKTAFKKLSQLKHRLATTSTIQPTQGRTRSAMNAGLHEAFEKKRSKRHRLREIDEIQLVCDSPDAQPNNINDSFDDEELNINIKIKWEGTSKVERVDFCMYKMFQELINDLSTREKIDAKSILLMFGKNVVKPDDSPHSIGYTLGKFISVRVVDNPQLYLSALTSAPQCNTIEVKIQSSQWKKPMICNIKSTDQFKVLTGMCSEKLQCNPNKIRFKFDGDTISITSTPDEYDFEGGEIIDLIIMAD